MPTVLFVAHQTGRAANGGIQSLEEILLRLSSVRPIVLTQSAGGIAQRWRKLGLTVLPWESLEDIALVAQASQATWGFGVLRRLSLVKQVLLLAQSNLRMAAFVRRRGIAVVHCNDGRAALSSAAGARLAGAAVVLNIRDTVLRDTRKWRLLGRLASHIIVLSQEMAEHVVERLSLTVDGLTDNCSSDDCSPGKSMSNSRVPLTVSYSAVNASYMKPQPPSVREALRRKLGIAPGVKAIGVVGALMGKKQQLLLLRHLIARPEQLPFEAQLFLIGDCDPETDEYSRLCVEAVRGSSLESRIHLVGYSEAVRDWYCALDLCLIASAKEGLARAMIESLACGTPVVSFDCCSAREVLEQEACGLVATQGDFEGLMAHATRLLADSEYYSELSSRARQVAVRLFEPQKVVGCYERVYLQLFKERRLQQFGATRRTLGKSW